MFKSKSERMLDKHLKKMDKQQRDMEKYGIFPGDPAAARLVGRRPWLSKLLDKAWDSLDKPKK